MLKHALIKLVVIPALCVSLALTPRSTEAIVLPALGAAAGVAGAAFVYIGYQYYLKNGKAKATTVGGKARIGGLSGQVYHALDSSGVLSVITGPANNVASVSPQYAYNMAKSHGEDFPLLKQFIDGNMYDQFPPPGFSETTANSGSLNSSSIPPFIYDGKLYTSNGTGPNGDPYDTCNKGYRSPWINGNGLNFYSNCRNADCSRTCGEGFYKRWSIPLTSTTDFEQAPPIETPEYFHDRLTQQSPSTGDYFYKQYEDELGTIVLIGMGSGAGTITDDEGRPVPLPPGYLTPSQAAELDSQHQSDERKRAAAASAAAAAAAAGSATNAARNRVQQAELKANNAANQLAADPGNAQLQQALDQAITELTTAEKDYADAQSKQHQLEQAVLEAEAAELDKELDKPPEIEPPPSLKRFSWVAAQQLMNQMETVWPFNLLLSISVYLQPLYTERTAPYYEIPLPFDKTLNIDMSPFDGIASITRWFFSLLLTITGIMAVVRWYRGGS